MKGRKKKSKFSTSAGDFRSKVKVQVKIFSLDEKMKGSSVNST